MATNWASSRPDQASGAVEYAARLDRIVKDVGQFFDKGGHDDALANAFDAFAAFGQHNGRAEFATDVGAVLASAQEQNPLAAEPLGGRDSGQADRASPMDRYRGTRPHRTRPASTLTATRIW